MNWKTSRKYFTEKKLTLGLKENTSALMNIAQEDDRNNFRLLKLVTKQASIYHLKML